MRARVFWLEIELTIKVYQFLIRARFVRRIPEHLLAVAENRNVYLGKRGQWCSIEKALRFRTRAAAEKVLDTKWSRLRSTGNKSVILTVVQVRAGEYQPA